MFLKNIKAWTGVAKIGKNTAFLDLKKALGTKKLFEIKVDCFEILSGLKLVSIIQPSSYVNH